MNAPRRLLESLMKPKKDFTDIQKLSSYQDNNLTIDRYVEYLESTEYYKTNGAAQSRSYETACKGKDFGLSPQMTLDLIHQRDRQ